MIEITHHVPQILVRRAILRDEMRERINRHLRRSAT
jgi:hypothetical protein